MSHVEVFKTNVLKKGDAEKIIKALSPAFPTAMINFDLEDVDSILRVEVQEGIIRTGTIISLLRYLGFDGEVLPDVPPPDAAGRSWPVKTRRNGPA